MLYRLRYAASLMYQVVQCNKIYKHEEKQLFRFLDLFLSNIECLCSSKKSKFLSLLLLSLLQFFSTLLKLSFGTWWGSLKNNITETCGRHQWHSMKFNFSPQIEGKSVIVETAFYKIDIVLGNHLYYIS